MVIQFSFLNSFKFFLKYLKPVCICLHLIFKPRPLLSYKLKCDSIQRSQNQINELLLFEDHACCDPNQTNSCLPSRYITARCAFISKYMTKNIGHCRFYHITYFHMCFLLFLTSTGDSKPALLNLI